MDVNEVLLPGVGLRYEFVNADGDRIGIVARRSGTFEVIGYSMTDPDEGELLFRLTAAEADTVAEILGAPRIAERFADLTKEVPGLSAGQIVVPPASDHVGQPLGHTRARTRTGASVVAIVRGGEVIASPPPDEVLRDGDVLVVIGTHEGITGVRAIIES
ncbi:cation:proton antiporter regulatory subunit [Amycolatopsis sp. lyj-108]|uniref:cation:proton antiporter regulatory subunit n=1 Tax=Amycolatopsis sp. lyj-108 TaxID=2789286 RepID=UPI00397B23A5